MASPVIWFELVVADFERAKAFYRSLLGWEFELLEGYDEEYWTIDIGDGGEGGIGGALTAARPGRQPGGGCAVYADVGDLEEAFERALGLGAQEVQPPRTITPTAGRFAVVADLDGNHVGLFTMRQ